jgi:hypothetical protein
MGFAEVGDTEEFTEGIARHSFYTEKVRTTPTDLKKILQAKNKTEQMKCKTAKLESREFKTKPRL